MGCHLQIQLPITLPDTSEPEPDVAIVKGPLEAFDDHRPTPADVLAAIEVADSSLRFDRSTKQRNYALAGIGPYWVVNLLENKIQCYKHPFIADGRYLPRADYPPRPMLPLRSCSSDRISVPPSETLPPSSMP